ncbi:LTA synthase family protein [uncultured Clostridium sp.]|uniref:LTA synthase family protein n=1 Tax=uncultured Clostridium sp. TaxID=59620 RepID=UPI0026149D23|nr:LTA synthase family protein [uncultured Clostridium sp.]
MIKYFKNFSLKDINKDVIFRVILFLIPLIGIVVKGIILQGFIQNSDPYKLNFTLGYDSARYCLTYYFAFTLIFLSFSLLFKGKGRVIYLFIVDFLLTILTLIDLCYFRGFLTVPSLLILTQTANLDNLSGTIFSLFSPADLLLFLDLVIMAIFVFFTRKSYVKRQKRAIKTFIATLILPILFIGYVPFNIYVLGNKDVKNAYFFDNYDPTNTVKYFSPIGYHIMDAINVYKDSKPYDLTSEDKAQINDYFNFKNENLKNNEYFNMAKGKNLIIIQVESLESFVMGQKINGQEITPVMDKLINQGLYFPNIYEQVNEGTSSDCDLMVNTSMFPLRRGSTFFRYPSRDYNSMPRILDKNGYNSTSIHPDKGSFWNYSNGLTGLGFENFTDFYAFNPDELVGMGLSDKTYFNQVVPMMEKMKQPFYVQTITLTNHGPFDLPKDMRKLNLSPELDKTEMGGYLESVHYTDAQIGYFLSLLKKSGLLDNSVIAIIGDHTGVHKYYQSSIDSLPSKDKEAWFDDKGQPTVPFILYDPSSKLPSKTFDTVGGQIDIMPTLLYALGIPSSEYDNSALGRNLLNTNRSYAALNTGEVVGNLKDLTPEQIQLIENSPQMSDKMIRANDFSK